MTAIFNESPVRQGRPFWHYGKNFETVKWQFARYLHRERMIGAYFDGELVGFIMLADAGRFGITGQIISSLKHRDKSPNNALIAKAVEVCAEQKLDCLVYLFWGDGSLCRVQATLRLRADARATLLGAAELEGAPGADIAAAAWLESADSEPHEGSIEATARALVRAAQRMMRPAGRISIGCSRAWGY